jgi:hypothetical protein
MQIKSKVYYHPLQMRDAKRKIISKKKAHFFLQKRIKKHVILCPTGTIISLKKGINKHWVQRNGITMAC